MLGCDHHIRDAVERVGPCRVDPQHVIARLLGEATRRPCLLPDFERPSGRSGRRYVKIDLRAGAAADPVALQLLDARGPVEPFELLLEPIGIGSDPQHPLAEWNADDRMAAPLAHAADHLLVGEHSAERGAPVDRCLRLIGEPVRIAIRRHGRLSRGGHVGRNRQVRDRPPLLLRQIEPGVEQHQENPLGPADVVGVRRRHDPAPVVAEAEHLELAGEGLDVAVRALPRRRTGADRVFLGG